MVSVLELSRRGLVGRHSTRPLEGNVVKFSLHRVGEDDYRRLDTLLSHELVQNAGFAFGGRIDVRFSEDMATATILTPPAGAPATRLQKRREHARPHGMVAVRIPVNQPVAVPCVEADIMEVRRGRVVVRVPTVVREQLALATGQPVPVPKHGKRH